MDGRLPRERERLRRRDPDHADGVAASAGCRTGYRPSSTIQGSGTCSRSVRSSKVSAVHGEHTAISGPQADGDLSAGPLSGITIIEAAYYYATPFATALLAELGARVIKIERVRAILTVPAWRPGGRGGGDPLVEPGSEQHGARHAGQGMYRSQLERPSGPGDSPPIGRRGRRVRAQFPAGCTGVTRNRRRHPARRSTRSWCTTTPPRTGRSARTRRQPAIDPSHRSVLRYHRIPERGKGNPPLTETGADPIAAAGHATSLMLGLFARHRTGRGQYVESAMIVSNIYLNCEDAWLVRRKTRSTQPRPAATGHLAHPSPLSRRRPSIAMSIAPYANPDPRWVFLSAEGDAQFTRFCALAGRADIAGDPRFSSRAARDRTASALEELLRGRLSDQERTRMGARGAVRGSRLRDGRCA